MVRRNLDGSTLVEQVIASISNNVDFTCCAMQSTIVRVGTFASKAVRTDYWRGIPRLPLLTARPERRHAQAISVRVGKHDIERERVEWIIVLALGVERELDHHVDWSFENDFSDAVPTAKADGDN